MSSSRSRRGHLVIPLRVIPLFLAANERRDSVVEQEGYFLDNKNKKTNLSPYAVDEKNQRAVFEKLRGYLEDH
jgi:hypothetical protein